MSSIFLDDKVLQFAAGNLNNITISNGQKIVDGQLQETLQFSVEADYDNIFSISEKFQGAKKIASSFNLGLFNAGIWTKKFYKGGSYLKINPKIRVTDWNGNGEVLRSASTLIDMCLPAYNGKLEKQFEGFVKNTIKKIENDPVKTGYDLVVKGVSEIAEDLESGKVAEKIFGIFKTGLSNSPTEVTVSVSTFFGPKQFIIESVQVEFSKEMTDVGPLYVDINLSMSTPMVTIKGGSGLHNVTNKPRFFNLD